jgi:hypothetical protein
MAQPFRCDCGMRTNQPYLINGEKLCVVCAEQIAPRLVSRHVKRNWQEFTQSNHLVPTRPGYRSRWDDDDE